MFIKSIDLKNYRLFSSFTVPDGSINIPDGSTEGSGLTIFVGENGTGKSSLLEAIALPLISYKSENMQLSDFAKIDQEVTSTILSADSFTVKKTMPNSEFEAIGFEFTGKVRSRGSSTYLVSPLVSDTKFIPHPSENVSATDLRTAVNNPFSGPRFNENDYLYIDKGRGKQLESGMFSSTRFDRILGDFNYQYLKNNSQELKNPNQKAKEEINSDSIENQFFKKALEDFKSVTDYEIELDLVNNVLPYDQAKLSFKDNGTEQIPVNNLGSGHQMLLALLIQYRLSLQSGKKLIILIDEVELHLHYKLQVSLAKLLLQISKTAQVIVTTHSAQLLKDLRSNTSHKLNVLVRNESNDIVINPPEAYALPSPSVNESSYVAFNMPTIEYFNELFGYLQDLKGLYSVQSFDNYLQDGSQQTIQWDRTDASRQNLTIHSCIRNKIHHPENTLNDGRFNIDTELQKSIEYLRGLIYAETT